MIFQLQYFGRSDKDLFFDHVDVGSSDPIVLVLGFLIWCSNLSLLAAALVFFTVQIFLFVDNVITRPSFLSSSSE